MTEKKKKKEVDVENVSIFGLLKWLLHFLVKVVLYSIFIIFLCIISIFLVYFIDQVRNIGQKQDPLFHAYVIVSPSMEPTINVHDAVFVKRKKMTELKTGDIICYVSTDPNYAGLTVTHRIVKIQKAENSKVILTTKGDNNNTEDSTYVTEENLIGKVLFKIPKIGYLQNFLLHSYGWIILIVLPCIGVIIYDIIKLIRSLRRNKEPVRRIRNKPIKKQEKIEIIGTETETKKKQNKDKREDEKIEILGDE